MASPMRLNNSIFQTLFNTLMQATETGWGGTQMLVSIDLLIVFVYASSTPNFSYSSFSLKLIADTQQPLLLRSSPMFGKQPESRNHARVL